MNNNYNLSVELLNEVMEESNEDNRGQNRFWGDDGAVGVVQNGVSYWYYIGQEYNRSEFSVIARRISDALGLPRSVAQYWINSAC